MSLDTMTVHIPREIYQRVARQARQMDKALDEWTRELIETALLARERVHPQTTAEVLQAAGRVRPLSESLRHKIIPGVTLDEVRAALTQAAGPSLSEIISEQRGPTL